jgi:hypothetical protein
VFCLCSCCSLHLLRRYSYTPTYPAVLTIVHLDGTSILSLYTTYINAISTGKLLLKSNDFFKSGAILPYYNSCSLEMQGK